VPTSNLSLHSILSVQFARRGLNEVGMQVLYSGCYVEYLTVLLMVLSSLLKLSSYRGNYTILLFIHKFVNLN